MPIFEYQCSACARVTSQVVLGSERLRSPRCSHCGSSKTHRVMSSFAVVETESQRINSFDPSKPADDSFYKDSRNVGVWAKKRAKQMGVELGSKFKETVEKARTGKLIKD